MRRPPIRWFCLLAVLVSSVLTSSSAASAASPRLIAAGGIQNPVVVSGGFAYFVGDGKACSSCSAVMRTELSSGLVHRLANLPNDLQVRSLEANANRVIIGGYDSKSGLSLAIAADGSGRNRQLLVEGRKSGIPGGGCPSSVMAGLISSSGEFSWELTTQTDCDRPHGEFEPTAERSELFTQRPGEGAQPAPGTWTGDSFKWGAVRTSYLASRIAGLNDRYILAARTENTMWLIDRVSGTRVVRPGLRGYDYSSSDDVLTAEGDSIGVRSVKRGKSKYLRPVVSRQDSRFSPAPFKPGSESQAVFCGKRIVQVTTVADRSRLRFAVVLRNLNGRALRTLVRPGSHSKGSVIGVACDEKTLVVRTIIMISPGVPPLPRSAAPAVELRNYAIDLP